MKKYLFTIFVLLTSISPVNHIAQTNNTTAEIVKEDPENDINLKVDSLSMKKENIIDKIEVIKKLELEKESLERRKNKVKKKHRKDNFDRKQIEYHMEKFNTV